MIEEMAIGLPIIGLVVATVVAIVVSISICKALVDIANGKSILAGWLMAIGELTIAFLVACYLIGSMI